MKKRYTIPILSIGINFVKKFPFFGGGLTFVKKTIHIYGKVYKFAILQKIQYTIYIFIIHKQ